jgi:hypothetical protein
MTSSGMSGWAPIEELAVPYDPALVFDKVARRRRMMRSRLISLGLSVIIVVALYFWLPGATGVGYVLLTGVLLGVSLAWFLVVLVSYRRAKAELAGLGAGTALRIGQAGVEVAGLFASWPEVARLAVVKGGLGRSPQLALTVTDGRRSTVPLDQVSVFPATLDSTARAYSAGRHGVDLSALEI